MANTYQKARVSHWAGYGYQDIYWYLTYQGVADVYHLHTRVDDGEIEHLVTMSDEDIDALIEMLTNVKERKYHCEFEEGETKILSGREEFL